jgi:glycerol kinase
MSQKPFQQFYPQDGWVEQDAKEIYKTALETLVEATGAAILAGLAIGVWKDKSEVKEFWKIKNRMSKVKEEKVEEYYKKWEKAVKRSQNWV